MFILSGTLVDQSTVCGCLCLSCRCDGGSTRQLRVPGRA